MQDHFTKKYLESFAFSNFSSAGTSKKFLFLKAFEGVKQLHLFDKEIHSCAEEAMSISEIDFNKQTCWPLKVINNTVYFISDKGNEENFNIFTIDLQTKNMKQVTENNYTACVHITNDETAYYASRKRLESGLFESDIHIHNLKTGENKVVANDSTDLYRIGWGSVTPCLNPEHIIVCVDKNNERTNGNFCLVNTSDSSKNLLIPSQYESARTYLLQEKIDSEEGFYFSSDCSGHDNIYYYSFENEDVQKLTHIDYQTDGFGFLESRGQKFFYHNQIEAAKGQTHIHLFKEVQKGVIEGVTDKLSFQGELNIQSDNLDYIWVGASHLTKPQEYTAYQLKDSKWTKGDSIAFYKNCNEKLVHSTHEFVKYNSYDDLEIPSFLVIPEGEIKGAVITSFYGGNNRFNPSFQIMAEMGFISLSPAVRGSWGYGKEWEDMLKGDLGGSEILDLIWAARYLEKKFNLKPNQIGLEGGSHGGYSTLRALTLPKSFKGQNSQYPFGFGICWAGFADLIDFYKTSNIPDWLSNLLGPLAGNEQLYKERSPLTYFKELKTPLFITHGTKDSRVPPSTMEGFLMKLKNSDIAHYIYLMDGQGHTGGSVEERIDEYKTMFAFLEHNTNLGWKTYPKEDKG